MNTVIDFETRSRIDIKKTGVYPYACDTSTDVLCIALKPGDDEIVLWSPRLKDVDQLDLDAPLIRDRELIDIIEATNSWSAHNAAFERLIWHWVMVKKYGFSPIPLQQWHCTAAQAAAMALPRKLESLAIALDLPVLKDKKGHQCMLKISKPIKKTGEWNDDRDLLVKVCNYCIQDVVVEDMVEKTLPPLSPYEQEVWLLDQEINDRGVHVDYAGAKALHVAVKAEEERLLAEIEKLTNGSVQSAKQVAKSLAWLKANDVELDNLQKATVTEAVEGLDDIDESNPAKLFLAMRQSLSKASVAKIPALLRGSCSDSRLRGLLLYHAATTGRWGGRLFQPHNLPRDSYKTEEEVEAVIDGKFEGCPIIAASRCLRGLVDAAPGKSLLAVDYSSVEARVTAWLAKEESALRVFRANLDPYKVSASQIYNVPYEKITKDQRQVGKTAELALGYQGWVAAFHKFAKNYGVSLLSDADIVNCGADYKRNITIEMEVVVKGKRQMKTVRVRDKFKKVEDFIQFRTDLVAADIIRAWRLNHPATKALWKGLQEAAFDTIKTGSPHSYGSIRFAMENDFLCMRLPSGRLLRYPYPKIEVRDTKYEKNKQTITFMGEDTYTKKWMRLSTYGGKLTENAVQAISRDLLVNSMFNVRDWGYDIVFHVHDEAVVEYPGLSDGHAVGAVENIMIQIPDWARGLPLGAEGWIGKRYRK